MPDEQNPTICAPPPSLQCVQTMAYLLAFELRSVSARIEHLHSLIEPELPENREAIWEGTEAPTLAIEVSGCLGVVSDDTLPECERLLLKAASATARGVAEEWRRSQRRRDRLQRAVDAHDRMAEERRQADAD